ncbi:MAG: hypothetical protein ACT4PT_13240 [Methanobacteriota archaeon]
MERFKKGEKVRVKQDPSLPAHYRGIEVEVRGMRPDGGVVVEFPNGIRRAFQESELERVP